VTKSDREKIEAYARVVSAAREVLRSMEGVRLPYRGEGWEKLLVLRNALAAFDKAHGTAPRSAAEGER
jgi:hypothetical protein